MSALADRRELLDAGPGRERDRVRSPAAAPTAAGPGPAETASAALRETDGDPRAYAAAPVPRRAQAIAALQRTAGNGAVSRVLAVQRHPEGSGLSVDPEAAVAEQEAEEPLAAEEAGIPQVPEGGELAPGAEAGAPAAPAPAAETGPETGTPAEAEGTAAPSAEGKKKPPAPAKPAYLDLATAKSVLEKAYGKSYTIKTGKISFLEDTAAAWKKYDEICIRDKIAGWKAGEAKKRYPLGLNGFFDKGDGTSYINKASALATTTPHEMLHANTGAGFRSGVGETLNEGTTQYLTVKALKASSIAVPKALPYADELGVAQALVDLVGESKVTAAYFSGGAAVKTLTDEVDTKLGAGVFAKVKAQGDKKAFSKAKDLLKLIKIKPPKKTGTLIDTNEYREDTGTAFA